MDLVFGCSFSRDATVWLFVFSEFLGGSFDTMPLAALEG